MEHCSYGGGTIDGSAADPVTLEASAMHLVNGRIYTQDRIGTVATAAASNVAASAPLARRRICRAGGDEIDLRGRTVLPGLIDAHAHLRNLAESRLSVDLPAPTPRSRRRAG